jgi:acyl carrier protein
MTKSEYEKIKETLKSELTEELKSEVEFAEFETDNEGLWDTPAVDSKAVIKISPVVEKHTGKQLDPSWIKCGGYESVPEAVDHIIEQLELEFDKG